MLSLILYGRNDSHGYNLHKRAAISLNAIGEVLMEGKDEIIFVDYNTPDELPTFLETIADTLTERVKKLIRIIRVRPTFHRRYADKTSLVALESQSRNIGIRRANPDNRWILSTNTDMIFLPAQPELDLGQICGDLPDGFYHLPRFELPESFWERADRLDPQGMMRALRAHGRRYHLNEVVFGGYDNVYEAPGDFQLFLRDDLYRIGGFDETMIRGWHVDTNTARRMKHLRSKVETLFPQIYGYHCGHTRQATSLHGSRRTENNLDTYARNVTTPFWTDQDTWGAPEETFEEVRLTESRSALYLAALDAGVPTAGPDYTEASYHESTYCEEGFDAGHVLPHLGDILFNMPPKQTVFMVGSDHELISGLSAFIASKPMEATLYVCGDHQSPGEEAGFGALDLEDGLARADVIVIQYPNVRTVPAGLRAELEWTAQFALERVAEIERRRPKAERRRIVVVNGMHSHMQNVIGATLDAAAIPFSARLRQGHVFDAAWQGFAAPDVSASDKSAYEALGRLRAFAPAEAGMLARILATGGAERPAGWERLASEVLALRGQRDFLQGRLSAEADAFEAAAILAERHLADISARCAAPPTAVPPRADLPNRIASAMDWEDPAWIELGVRYFGERAYELAVRSRWLWERVSLLHELRQRLAPGRRPWVLVLADGPDIFAAMAAHQGYRIAYATPAAVLAGSETGSWREAFRLDSIVLPASLMPLSSVPADVKFDAVVATGACLFAHEADRAARVIAAITPRMQRQAHFGASSLVHLNGNAFSGALSHAGFCGALEPDGLLVAAGLEGDAPVDGRIPLDTAARFAFEDKEGDSVPGLAFGFAADTFLSICSLWARFADWPRGRRVREFTQMPLVVDPSPAIALAFASTIEAPVAAISASPGGRGGLLAQLGEQVLTYPAVFGNVKRNLLPSIVGLHILSRSPGAVVIGTDDEGRIRFGVPIAAFDVNTCELEMRMRDVSGAGQMTATFIGKHGEVAGHCSVAAGRVTARFAPAADLGEGIALFELMADALVIEAVSATRTSPAMASA